MDAGSPCGGGVGWRSPYGWETSVRGGVPSEEQV